MPDFLTTMARSSAARVAQARTRCSEACVHAAALATPPPATLTFHPGGFDVIAEIKRRSPSTGALVDDTGPGDTQVCEQAERYGRAGALAVSVLSEPSQFGGQLDHVTAAARVVPIPVMRKDFLVDPYQVFEARLAGAAGVLLIARILDAPHMQEMLDAAAEARLFSLIEIFDEDDLTSIGGNTLRPPHHGSPDVLIGVNTRDLTTLAVDPDRLQRLVPQLPAAYPRVAESGVQTPRDAGRIACLGYDVALVGSALMKATDPTHLLAEMIAAGRNQAMNECV